MFTNVIFIKTYKHTYAMSIVRYITWSSKSPKNTEFPTIKERIPSSKTYSRSKHVRRKIYSKPEKGEGLEEGKK